MSKIIPHQQALALIKKHIRAMETITNYDSDDDTNICKHCDVMYPSNLQPASLETIQRTFRIPSNFMMVESIADDRAHLPSKGSFTVYQEQLKAGTTMLTGMIKAAIKMKMAPPSSGGTRTES
ncbi:hypothetical protein M9H77_22810 [Catharanthus roseus]|uniref:Uncharacterized protein n=1 Tax=Catharanthus roseus TaxID=4058 RepID=A0ACC0ASS3_CATRO|nr:hypothetical protein M9H77_22810 [Catharanthus roseus]